MTSQTSSGYSGSTSAFIFPISGAILLYHRPLEIPQVRLESAGTAPAGACRTLTQIGPAIKGICLYRVPQ